MAEVGKQKASEKTAKAQVVDEAVMEAAAQYFGFSPKAYCDTVSNVMHDCYMKAVKENIHDELLRTEGVDKEALEVAFAKLTCSLDETSRKLAGKFEEYVLQRIFVVPPYVPLAGTDAHQSPAASVDPLELDDDIAQLELQLAKANAHNDQLERQVAFEAAVRERLDANAAEAAAICAEIAHN